jgi:hypothetical protein
MGDARRTLTREIDLSVSPHERNNVERNFGHCLSPKSKGSTWGRPDWHRAGTSLRVSRAQVLPNGTLVDWQAYRKPISNDLIIITNSANSVSRLTNLGPHPTQSISVACIFDRLKIVIRWAPVSRKLPGFGRGRTLAKDLALFPQTSRTQLPSILSAQCYAKPSPPGARTGALAPLRAHFTGTA